MMSEPPDVIVSKKIATVVSENALLSQEDMAVFEQELALGQVTADRWHELAKNAISREEDEQSVAEDTQPEA